VLDKEIMRHCYGGVVLNALHMSVLLSSQTALQEAKQKQSSHPRPGLVFIYLFFQQHWGLNSGPNAC
jgi:hypothetical protein